MKRQHDWFFQLFEEGEHVLPERSAKQPVLMLDGHHLYLRTVDLVCCVTVALEMISFNRPAHARTVGILDTPCIDRNDLAARGEWACVIDGLRQISSKCGDPADSWWKAGQKGRCGMRVERAHQNA